MIGSYDGDIGGPTHEEQVVVSGGRAHYQDINTGVPNFFDTTLAGCNPPPRHVLPS